ncbi:MAG: TetR family transcriptional regulator [Deltaproteobacteria bacterium]|nr:TetR family transcriptional regulator [Deltaproteobacteria bacterium]
MAKANMKETIKAVSIDLFYKKGYFASSINDIARASGIQKSSIYYHYSNKEDILFDILKTTMIDLDANLEKQLKGIEDTEERMRTAIHSHTLFHMERQKEVIISDSEIRGLTVDNYKTIIKMRDEYDHKFQSIIKRGIDEGVFAENDYKILSYAIITMCTAVSIWFNPQGRLSKEEIAQIYTDFNLKAIKVENFQE